MQKEDNCHLDQGVLGCTFEVYHPDWLSFSEARRAGHPNESKQQEMESGLLSHIQHLNLLREYCCKYQFRLLES